MNRQTRLDTVVRTLELLRKEVERAFDEGRIDDAVALEERLENDWLRLGTSARMYWVTEQRIKEA